MEDALPPLPKGRGFRAGNRMNRSKWIAVGCGIGAGALAVTALVTYLLNSGTEESKSNTTVSLSPFGLGVKF